METLREILNRWKVLIFKGTLPNTPVEIEKVIPYNKVIFFGALDGDRITRVDTRKFKGGDDLYVLLYEVPAGTFVKHFHPNMESGLVLKGRMLYKNPYTTVELFAGDNWKIEKGVWHTFEFLEPSLCIVFFHPTIDNRWEASVVK